MTTPRKQKPAEWMLLQAQTKIDEIAQAIAMVQKNLAREQGKGEQDSKLGMGLGRGSRPEPRFE